MIRALLVTLCLCSTAYGLPAFKREFDARYVKRNPTTQQEQQFALAVRQANCLVCHGRNQNGREDKRIRNSYGQALSKYLRKTDASNIEVIQASLAEVAKEKSDPANPNSPTFGELIGRGLLPGR